MDPDPWADVAPSQSSTGTPSAEPSQPEEASTSNPSSTPSAPSGQSSSNTKSRPSRTQPRRLVAQPTQLQAVEDDPLGPLGVPGPLGGDAQASDAPPAPPSKEQSLPVRTTLPQQQSRRSGPLDPHGIPEDDDLASPSGARQPPPVQAALVSPVQSSTNPSVSLEQAARPVFHITVGDPHKVGDLTSSHIVYSVRTNTTSKAYKQPDFEVKRRYRDFLWLYNTLHANNPGVVVPPPPEKQAVGRFQSDFVESRRAALEKMLNKTAAHPTLQQDADLKLFLESETFNIDVKHKERREPQLGESKGFFGISVGGGGKFVEQDDVSHPFPRMIAMNV